MKIHSGEQYCPICGSKEVQIKGWVNCNTGYGETDDNPPKQDQWCAECEEHVNISFAEKDIEFNYRIKRGYDSVDNSIPEYLMDSKTNILSFPTKEDAKKELLKFMTEEQIEENIAVIEMYEVGGHDES